MTPAELRAALKTFKRWFFPQQGDDAPEPNPVADAVYELLAELLARKVKLARAADDDRFRLLNRHWHALTDLTTRRRDGTSRPIERDLPLAIESGIDIRAQVLL